MSDTKSAASDVLADATIHQQWASTYRTPETQAFYDLAFDAIVSRLNAPPHAAILDAGCGSCAKSVLLATRGFRVIATDFSASALEMAAQTLRARGLDDAITLRTGDLLNLPFRDGEFQYVMCWGVLMHIPELQRAQAELARVLAPGGRLVISEGNMYAAQSLALRWLKRLFGRERARVVRTPAGLESWEETGHGTLLTRQTDMGWFVDEWRRLGLQLNARMAGQLTELYALVPWRPAKRMIHTINNAWFRHVRWAGPAFGNILILEKK